MARRSLFLLLVTVVVVGATTVAAATRAPSRVSGADASHAQLTVTPSNTAPGDRVQVQLTDWPPGAVSVGVCGNGARRGSEDCDQVTIESVAARDGSALLRVTIPVPPVGCPCVVRAWTTDNSVVRVALITIAGVPTSPPLLSGGGAPSARALAVSTRIESGSHGLLDAAGALFAGPVHRTLVLTVDNQTANALGPLRIVSVVGRDRVNAQPLPPARISELGAGERRIVRIPLTVSAPAWGDYEVFGSVYGAATPIRFAGPMTNDPWGLEVLVPATLLVWAQVRRRKERRMRARVDAAAANPGSSDRTQTLPQSSFAVVGTANRRWPVAAYDPNRSERADEPLVAHASRSAP